MIGRILRDGRSWALLALWATAVGLVRYVSPEQTGTQPGTGRETVHFEVDQGSAGTGRIFLRSSGGGQLFFSEDNDGALTPAKHDQHTLQVQGNARRTEHLVTIPTSLKWRRPFPGQPSAMIVRAVALDGSGQRGPERFHTVPMVDHGALPVLSMLVQEGALFDPDTGIYVVGNAMLRGVRVQGGDYESDARWWKYPGNYHGRGREWERRARMQLIAPDGRELFQGSVRLRINGQLTRAFPQHALRVLFDDPLPITLFNSHEGEGMKAMIIRSAGNDQIKAFMRDAVLQRICSGTLVEVSDARTCVVYINGAYWGIHQIRQRMDEKEMARRHDISAKEVAFVEEMDGSLSGEWLHIKTLKRLATAARTVKDEDPEFITAMSELVDMDAFLQYMAIMLIVDNRDWPRTNTKFWRRTGKAAHRKDSLWRPVLQDLDLAFGANSLPSADPWQHIRSTSSPITDLFHALMCSPEWQGRFQSVMLELLKERFATENVIAHVDAMVSVMAPEMDRHTARWRKPANAQLWLAEVEVLRDFARRRPEVMRRLLTERAPQIP